MGDSSISNQLAILYSKVKAKELQVNELFIEFCGFPGFSTTNYLIFWTLSFSSASLG